MSDDEKFAARPGMSDEVLYARDGRLGQILLNRPKAINALTGPMVTSMLEQLQDWNATALHGALEALAQEKSLGLGKVAQPLRVAVTGGTISPPIDQTLTLLGRERTLARLRRELSA